MTNIKVLDCTLRDGGYYNNWDFSDQLVSDYLEAAAASKIDFIELGLRSFGGKIFKGATAYTTEAYLNRLNLPLGPKYGVMIDAKTFIGFQGTIVEGIESLFVRQDKSKLDFVRVATHYHELGEALLICSVLKDYGYFVGINLMQSVGKPDRLIVDSCNKIYQSGVVDVLYYADSLGNMDQEEQERIYRLIRECWRGEVGLHAHDNTSAGLSNVMSAIDLGVTYIDSTMTGMGRGAGNVKTEILLTELCRRNYSNYNPECLYELIVKDFEPLQKTYGWGTNMLYHIGALNSIHPTYIQQLYTDTRFGSKERVAAIKYLMEIESSSYDESNFEQSLNNSQDASFTICDHGDDLTDRFIGKEIVIVGGGENVSKYNLAIRDYIEHKKPIVISLNIIDSLDYDLIDYYVATHNVKFLTDQTKYSGIEGKLIAPKSRFERHGIKPDISYELRVDEFWRAEKNYCVTPYELALAYALSICEISSAGDVSLVGFDGYRDIDIRNQESQDTLDHFKGRLNIICLTPSNYNITMGSIYELH